MADSDVLRELLVKIAYEDNNVDQHLTSVNSKVDNVKSNIGQMGTTMSSVGKTAGNLGSTIDSTAGTFTNFGNQTTDTIQNIGDLDEVIRNSSDNVTDSFKRIDNQTKLWQLTSKKTDKSLESNKRKTQDLRDKIDVLGKEIKENNSTLDIAKQKYGENSKEVQKLEDHILELKVRHAELNKELKNSSLNNLANNLNSAGAVMTSVGRGMTRYVTLPLLGAGIASVKTAIDLEDAFASVRRTVEGPEETLNNIKKSIDTMANTTLPVAREELYGIAANAGSLGIATDDVVHFTEVIAKLVATSDDLTADTSSKQLAQFAGFIHMDMKDVDRLGASITELGNKTKATEGEIVDMAMRVGAAGYQVGMAPSTITGLATGIASLGLEAEAGGTAISKLLFEMQSSVMTADKNLNKFAKVAGMTGQEFQEAFQKDASGALVAFIQGLGEVKDAGGNTIGILNDLGIKEVRMRDAILRAAGAEDLLRNSIEMGNEAWEENTALNEEFEKRSNTAAKNFQLLKNKIQGLGEVIGLYLLPYVTKGVEIISNVIEAFGQLDEKEQKMIVKMGIFAMVLGPIIFEFGKLFMTITNVIYTVQMFGGILPMLLSPAGIAVLAIGGIITAGILLIKNWDSIVKFGEWAWGKIKTIFGGIGNFAKKIGGKIADITSKILGLDNTEVNVKINEIPNKIGRNATGTNYWAGGLTSLSENNRPELVVGKQVRDVPAGAKIYNARDTAKMFNNGFRKNNGSSYSNTFAPVINVYPQTADKKEIMNIKREVQRALEPELEKYFYKMKLKRSYS